MSMIHKRMVGDTLTPLNFWLSKPVPLAGKTVKFQIEKDDGTVMLAETATGITQEPTVTFTVDTTNNWVVANDNGILDMIASASGKVPQLIVSNSGGALPTGLAASTRYFVKDVTENNFRVSLTKDGAAVTISGAGTGTHSYYIVGSGQYTFASAAVASEYTGRGWATVFSGSDRDSYPTKKEGIRIEVMGYGN